MARRTSQRALREFAGVVQWQDASLHRFHRELVDVANDLEDRIRTYVQEFTVVGGRFVGDERSLARLARLQSVLDSELVSAGYPRAVRRLLEENRGIATQIERAYRAVVRADLAFTTPDLDAMRLALGAQAESFAAIGNSAMSTIAEGIARQVAGESSFPAWKDQLRAVLIGSGRRDKAGQGMFRHADTLAETAMSQLHRTMDARLAEQAGVKRFVYYGPDDKVTRRFCARLLDQAEAGKTWTRQQIARLDNGQTGKGTAYTAGGGWNCRHVWIAAVDEDGIPIMEDAA